MNNDWRKKLSEWLAKGNSPTVSGDLRAVREEFVKKFPSKKLRDLTLEQYALGHDKSKNSFCYWLETKTRKLGSINGGSAAKFGVYWSRTDNAWRPNKFYKDADDARERLTNGIATLVEAAGEKKFNDLDAIGHQLLGYQRYSLRVKPLSLYFPDDFLPISSLPHLKFFLSLFGQVPEGEVIACNRQLLQWMQPQPEFTDFDSYGLMRFLYDAFPSSKDKVEMPEKTQDKIKIGMSSSFPIRTPPKNFPLNQILYGPPGTGKTYATIRRAVEIVEGAAPQEQRECKAHFDALMNGGRIAFVTFHQSFAYEDFIEGIRPAPEGDGAARYELRDGLLKEIALRAFGACLEATRPGEATFQDVWSAFEKQAEENPEWRLPGLGSSKYKIWFTGSGDVLGDNIAGKAKGVYCAPRQKLEMLWDKLRDSPKIATREAIMDIIRKGSHVHFLSAIFEELKRLKPNAGPPSTDAPSREAIVTFLGGGDEYRLKLTPAPRFVLIIDEINRGNISKILGELITLLEDDKRLPGDNSLRVKLPYSGEMFALPSNLHVLGTMNTADKSLALVDVALRRRFDFEELAPDFTLCEKLTPEMRAVLIELNRRITLRKDREHRIGHAYFMKTATKDDFDNVFRKRVIPLLQEYFFNDWDGLRFVLGESGKGRFVRELPNPTQAREARNRWAWWFDENSGDGACFEWLKTNYAGKENDGA